MTKGLSITRLESFIEVADRLSVTRAAGGRPVRQSQLSRQIGELGEHFGKALLERRGRGIALTPAGERLAAVTRQFLNGLKDVREDGSDAPVAYTAGAGDSVLQWWVVPRIDGVAKAVPRSVATLTSLSSVDIVAQLKDGRLDFGVVRGKHLSAGLESRPLGALEYALYAPRKLLARAATDDVSVLLCTLPFALQHSEPSLNEPLEKLAAKRGRLNTALSCETFPQAYRALRTGHYAALLPTIVDSRISSKEFAEVKVAGLGRFAEKIALAWHPRTMQRNESLRRVAKALENALLRAED